MGKINPSNFYIVSGSILLGRTSMSLSIIFASINISLNTTIALGDTNAGAQASGNVIYTHPQNPSSTFSTTVPGSSGSVKVMSKTNSQISGIFSFTAKRINGTEQVVVTDGAFNVEIVQTPGLSLQITN
jgi:hypothetical protein